MKTLQTHKNRQPSKQTMKLCFSSSHYKSFKTLKYMAAHKKFGTLEQTSFSNFSKKQRYRQKVEKKFLKNVILFGEMNLFLLQRVDVYTNILRSYII